MVAARYLACLIAAVAAAPSIQAAVLVETGSEAQAGKLMRREAGGRRQAKEKSNVQKYKELITEIYQEHNKEKLNEIDDLLKKYEGKEKTLYVAICTEYKIKPKDLGMGAPPDVDTAAREAEAEKVGAEAKKLEDKIFGESQKEDDSREAEEEDVEADHERTPSYYYYYHYYYYHYR